MSTYTSSPWWVTDAGVRNDGGYICLINKPSRYYGQNERYEKETTERQANAQLIAAAPQLFEALQNLLGAHAIPSSICKERPAYEAAQAAIAKAVRHG